LAKKKKECANLYKTFLYIDENKNPAPHQHHFDISEGFKKLANAAFLKRVSFSD
jgi:hypothetical protein